MGFLCRLYSGLSGMIEKMAGDWFLGLAARLVFASVLLGYFFNSAMTKFGSGFPGLFVPQDGAYIQILPTIMEGVGYDSSQIGFFPWGLIVWAGSYAELLLPLAVIAGLLTRLSALGMMGFIMVQTFVDINFHHMAAKDIGLPFDRIQDSIVADQRLLWLFPLLYLVIRGAGTISLDQLIFRKCG